jgi:hypothetical protein
MGREVRPFLPHGTLRDDAEPRIDAGEISGVLRIMSDRESSSPTKTPRRLPFADSLCHRCDAPRYVETATSVFILCPRVPKKYPLQPVHACELFRPRHGTIA